MANEISVSDKKFDKKFYYSGSDLGAVYSPRSTSFRVWSPTADGVTVCLYNDGAGEILRLRKEMKRGARGTWFLKIDGDLDGAYYTYEITRDGECSETVDIYAKACSADGKTGQIVDMRAATPKGYKKYRLPKLESPVDAVIYELHIRDYSINKNGGFSHNGKYLALTEHGTKNAAGEATGIDHLSEMGVTHVQLMPIQDFCSVSEEKGGFNWGYDPENYNVPEGSYATEANNGAVRIRELKELILALHKSGIRVVMDVVYNHTGIFTESGFQQTVPDYFYRFDKDGLVSNGSGCGNETASEHAMMRKFIVDSVSYWAKEYRVDGFRFDLMGLHDIDTMCAVRRSLDRINPEIMIYGEGWTGGNTPLPQDLRAVRENAKKLPRIAFFSDSFRDAIKGNVFNGSDLGFVSGGGKSAAVKSGLVGGIKHKCALPTDKITFRTPEQVINYCECHDNNTLWDKLAIAAPNAPERDRILMDKLAATAVFTAQGIPFIHEGQEFLRTKKLPDGSFDANSYMSSDEVNGIDWDMKTVNSDVYNYYKGLIALRKAHPAFRMANAAEIRKNLKFIKTDDDNLIAYKIVTDNEKILVALNGAKGSRMLKVPSGRWHVYSDGNKSSAKPIGKIHGGKIVVPAYSALVIGKPNFDKLRNAAIATGVVVAAGVAVKLALSSDNKQIKEFRKNAEKEALYAAGKAVKFTGKAVKSLSEDKSVKALRNLFDEKFKF